MKTNYMYLSANQLSRRLTGLSRAELREPPGKGWICSIRKALGMSSTQLAKLIGVSQPMIMSWQQREAKGTISLQSLRKVADAMQCDLVYALVPRKPFKKILEERALRQSQSSTEQIGHSMSLEDQQTSSAYRKESVKETARRLLEEKPKRLWDS